jgi:plasmid stabilization system protein ParE
MLAHLQLATLAEIELSEAIEYLEVEARMGLAFAREVHRVIDIAMRFPQSGTLVPQNRVRRQIRLFRLNPEFPYDVVATVIEEQDLLLVLAVAHHKREPGYWIGRTVLAKR